MSKNVLILLKILENEHVYSLKKLKEKLLEQGLDLTENQIINLIIDSLFESICHFKLEKKYHSNILYKCFKYLNADNNQAYLDDVDSILEKINRIINKIDKKIDSRKWNINNICRTNIQFLNKIKDNLELTIIQFNINKDIAIDNNETIENTLYKFIFDIKKYNYVEEIFKTFPELLNFKSHDNKYILDKVITKYIECLNIDNSSFDIVYYDKIIKLFLNNHDFNITRLYRDSLVTRLELVLNNLNTNTYSRRRNKKIRFFINDIIDCLQNVEITDTEKFFSNINYRYGIKDNYNGNYYDMVKSQNNLVKLPNITDLTSRYTFTVDNKGTKSFDDAFSLTKTNNGNYELDVYISDVHNHVIKDTKLDQLALKKGSTIYLPDHILTMLPHSLTFDNCSLIKNNSRNVIAHRFILSKNFDIISFDIFEAIININDNFYYDNIIEILNSNDVEKLKTLSTMIDIANNFKRNRIYNVDYHKFKNLRYSVLNPSENRLEKYTSCHTSFVDVFMILTNHFVSDLFDRLDFPFIYRVNTSIIDDNVMKELNKLKEEQISNKIMQTIENSYKPSYYSAVNLGHSGLDLASYCHITIPIRNYISLHSQRLEYKYLISDENITDKDIYNDEEEIANIINYENDRIFYNEEYVREYKEKYKCLKLD